MNESDIMALARLLFSLIVSVFLATSALADGQRVILVLDASGSMWGQINGTAKIDIAKQVVGKVISNWKADDEIGLVVYGHRKKGACDDIETLIEPGALNAEGFMQTVQGLNAKGKTPMTQAIRQAAEALKFTEKQATVILVSDGIETCDPNPCAVADELEKLGVGLTVHTVGFGLDDKGAVAQLKCLAENTGGKAVLADSADELEDALKQTVEAKVEEPTPEPVVALEFNVLGHVVMAEGVELPEKYASPTWAFFKAVNGERGKQVGTEYYANMKASIKESGDYIVRISEAQATIEVPFTVTDGEVTKIEANFNAGIVKVFGFMDETTPIPEENSNAAWELFGEKNNRITTEYGGSQMFMSNAGQRKVRLKLGEAKTEQMIEFVAGQATEQNVVLGAGVIEVSGVFSEGGKAVPEGAAFELLNGEPDLEGKYERLSTDYAAPTRFSTPAGKYRVNLSKDYASATIEVDLKSGAREKIVINLNAGYLAIKAPGASRFEFFTAEKDLAGERQRLGTEYGEELNKAFNAGTYHVIVFGAEDKILSEQDHVVKAGARTEVNVP